MVNFAFAERFGYSSPVSTVEEDQRDRNEASLSQIDGLTEEALSWRGGSIRTDYDGLSVADNGALAATDGGNRNFVPQEESLVEERQNIENTINPGDGYQSQAEKQAEEQAKKDAEEAEKNAEAMSELFSDLMASAAATGATGYAVDNDRVLAVEEKQTNMAMGVDLDAYDKLVQANIPYEDLAYARSLGKDDKEMLFNHESGLAVDGGKMVESGLPLQVQRQIDAIQTQMTAKDVNYVDTEDRERAAKVDNGVEASSLGALASARAASVMMG